MTAPLTGYNSDFPADVLLDSGVLYIGSLVWGAFSGGIKFDPGVTYRNTDFDGKRSPVKGLDRVTMRMPKITGTVIQLTPVATANAAGGIAQVEPGAAINATGAWTGATSYAPKSAGHGACTSMRSPLAGSVKASSCACSRWRPGCRPAGWPRAAPSAGG